MAKMQGVCSGQAVVTILRPDTADLLRWGVTEPQDVLENRAQDKRRPQQFASCTNGDSEPTQFPWLSEDQGLEHLSRL